jgi:hypothetical protein
MDERSSSRTAYEMELTLFRRLYPLGMEQSGMRWTQAGAQAILDLQAVRVNDDWDAYQRFRRHRQHQRSMIILMTELFALRPAAQMLA